MTGSVGQPEPVPDAAAQCLFLSTCAESGRAQSDYEDETFYVILDIGPVAAGHSMVIPKTHAPYLRDLDDATWSHVCVVAKRLERAIATSGVRCEGTNVFLADGEAAFQEVFHLHLHVVPRYKGDSFIKHVPNG